MGVRKVSHRGGNMIGLFPSIKMERMVAFESLIEQDYLYVLDYEPGVLGFEEQPLTIEYQWEDKPRRYTPDFQVRWGDREELVECKPASRVDTEENQRKFAAARQWCQHNGQTFAVVTDEALRGSHRLANIKLLTRYARMNVPAQITQQVTQHLQDTPSPLTLHALACLLSPRDPQSEIATLLCLTFRHHIVLPLTQVPISGDTPVYPATGG